MIQTKDDLIAKNSELYQIVEKSQIEMQSLNQLLTQLEQGIQ